MLQEDLHTKVGQGRTEEDWSQLSFVYQLLIELCAGTIQKLNLDLAGNNTWAVCVPYGFRYPKEAVNISRTETPGECAYPEFINWARDRNSCQDWYLHPNEGYVMR